MFAPVKADLWFPFFFSLIYDIYKSFIRRTKSLNLFGSSSGRVHYTYKQCDKINLYLVTLSSILQLQVCRTWMTGRRIKAAVIVRLDKRTSESWRKRWSSCSRSSRAEGGASVLAERVSHWLMRGLERRANLDTEVKLPNVRRPWISCRASFLRLSSSLF